MERADVVVGRWRHEAEAEVLAGRGRKRMRMAAFTSRSLRRANEGANRQMAELRQTAMN